MFFRLVFVFPLLVCFTTIYSQEYEVELTESKNVYFSNQIDSLMEPDQRVRTKRKYIRAARIYNKYRNNSELNKNDEKYLRAKKLMDEWEAVDSSNIYHLIGLIDKYGFPSKNKIGRSGYNDAFVLMFHFDKDTNSLVLKPILDSALKNNEISPQFYSMIIDRHLCYGGKTPIYYSWCFCDYPNLSDEEKKVVAKNRRRIGLSSETIKCGSFKKYFKIE